MQHENERAPRYVDDREAYLNLVGKILAGNLRETKDGSITFGKLGPHGKGDVSWHFKVAVTAQQILECMDRVYSTRKPVDGSSSSDAGNVGGAW